MKLLLLPLAALLLLTPEIAAVGVRAGIDLCLQTVIPSLFIFMILCQWIALSDIAFPFRIFGLPKEAGSAVLLGFIGGYPVGARMASELKRKGALTAPEAETLAAIAFSVSPAFLTGISRSLFGSGAIGLVLYLCQLLASLLTGLFLRIKTTGTRRDSARPLSLPSAARFVSAVSASVSGMGAICGYVILFSVVSGYLQKLPGGLWASAFLEVSVGCQNAASLPFLPSLLMVSGCCSLGGVSVWLQNRTFLGEIPMKRFFIARAIHLPLALMLTLLAEKLLHLSHWQAASSVYTSFSEPIVTLGGASPLSSVFLVISGLLLLLGGRQVWYTKDNHL